MTVNKYVGDYRLIEEFDEKGRVRTSTEYIGDDYYYLLEDGPRLKTARTVTVAVALEWACWIGALVPYSHAMQHMYVSLPFVFAAVPLFLLTEVVFGVLRRPHPLERRHADRIRNRYPAAAAIGGTLVAFAFVGAVVSLVLTADATVGDAVFLGCAAYMLSASLLSFSKKDDFAVVARPGNRK